MKGTQEGVGVWEGEEKAASTGCASEQIATVGDLSSILWGASEKSLRGINPGFLQELPSVTGWVFSQGC